REQRPEPGLREGDDGHDGPEDAEPAPYRAQLERSLQEAAAVYRIAPEPAAQGPAERVHAENQHDECAEQGRHLSVLEEAHGKRDLRADASRSDEAEHGR